MSTRPGRLPQWAAALDDDVLAQLRLLTIHFLARLNPRLESFFWPDDAALLQVQDVLVEALQLKHGNEHASRRDIVNCNGNEEYICTFLRAAIARLEQAVEAEVRSEGAREEDITVNDELYEMLASLMANTAKGSAEPAPRTVTYVFPLGEHGAAESSHSHPLFLGWGTVYIVEETTTISRGTTGLKTWEAALRLAEHLVAQRDALYNRRILELGCGTGFLGIVSSMLGAKTSSKVLLTDLDGQVLQRAQSTVDQNLSSNSRRQISVQSLDWIEVRDKIASSCKLIDSFGADLLVAADVVFDPELLDALCAVIERAVLPQNDLANGPTALIASTVRNADTFAQFLQALERRGLTHVELPLTSTSFDLIDLTPVDSSHSQNGSMRMVHRNFQLFPSQHHAETYGTVRLLRISR